MIAAFTRARCTISLGVVDRSLKVFWRGWTQAPHNAVKIVHTEMMNENVPQCIVQGHSVRLQFEVDSEVGGEQQEEERIFLIGSPTLI